MSEIDKKFVYSKPIIICMDYIYNHLHETIRIDRLADFVGLNRSYFSTLFKRDWTYYIGLHTFKTDGGCTEYAAFLGLQLC